jgi:hypothetical protein
MRESGSDLLGSGRRMLARAVLLALVMVVGVSWGAGSAYAGSRHDFLFSFGPGGPGSGAFVDVQSVAVDAAGDVYVYDVGAGGGSVYKFNAAGEPVKFSGLSGNVIEGVGGSGNAENEIAVSSAGPTAGDIYIARYAGKIEVFAASGLPLGALEGGGPGLGSDSCGVATDAVGDLYVSLATGFVNEYVPTGKLVDSGDYLSSLFGLLREPCNIAADGSGGVWEIKWSEGPVTHYAASQFNTSETPAAGSEVDAAGSTLAADPAGGVYVDERDQIAQYGPTGKLLDTFAASSEVGAVGGSFGIGVSAPGASGEQVYVADGTSETINVFSDVVPDVSTGGVSGVAPHAATLEGQVDPYGMTLTECEFEYGTSTAYGQSAPCSPAPSGGSPVAVTAQLSGLAANTEYHYRLVAANSNGSVEGRDAAFTTPKAPPVVIDAEVLAAGVSQLQATLSGAVNPEGLPASYQFEYGTTPAYGSSAPATAPGALPVNATADAVTQTLLGLRPGTTYHYALLANSPGGTTVGEDHTFTTPPVPLPAVSTGGASEVGVGAAGVSGEVDPQGWDTTYVVQYGTSVGYGSEWPTVAVDMGALEGAQPVTLYLQNLQPGTLYHYRLVATSPGGTSYGADETFTTLEYPASVIQEPPVLGPPIGIAPAKEATTTSHKSAGAKKPKHRQQKRRRPVPRKKHRGKR